MFSPDLLIGKVALVTGSTSGIGLATAEQLGLAGAKTVVINGRDADAGMQALDRLRKRAPATVFHFVAADYRRPEPVEHLFRRVAEEGGGLDIFVHTGIGGNSPAPFMSLEPESWQDTLDGKFISLMACCRQAIPLMMARGGGAIVSVASDAAKLPTPGESVIGGALAANAMFMRTLALEVGRHKIRANVVTPSITRDTRTYDRVMASEFSRKLFQKAESRARLGVPSAKDVAPIIVFLASPMASHITGQVISANGGISVA